CRRVPSDHVVNANNQLDIRTIALLRHAGKQSVLAAAGALALAEYGPNILHIVRPTILQHTNVCSQRRETAAAVPCRFPTKRTAVGNRKIGQSRLWHGRSQAVKTAPGQAWRRRRGESRLCWRP